MKAHAERAWATIENDEDGSLGVQAHADIVIPTAENSHAIVFRLSSPGLWGIDEDSLESYFDEVAQDEYATLRSMLEALNIDPRWLPETIVNAGYASQF